MSNLRKTIHGGIQRRIVTRQTFFQESLNFLVFSNIFHA